MNNKTSLLETHPKEINSKSSSFVKPFIFFQITLIVVLTLISSYLFITNQSITKSISSQKDKANEINTELEEDSHVEAYRADKTYGTDDEFTGYFVSDILPNYPEIRLEIEPDQITKTLAISLKDGTQAWVIETESNENKHSHYLVSNSVQKKLLNSMLSQSGAIGTCELSDILTVGNYLILPSTDCVAYGSGNTIAVYSLSTGDQVKLFGQNFTKSGTTWKALSEEGNTFGDLIGVYGLTKPKLVVKYGDQNNPVVDIVYFDLETGRLVKRETFR